jgi:hypothetical protein
MGVPSSWSQRKEGTSARLPALSTDCIACFEEPSLTKPAASKESRVPVLGVRTGTGTNYFNK